VVAVSYSMREKIEMIMRHEWITSSSNHDLITILYGIMHEYV